MRSNFFLKLFFYFILRSYSKLHADSELFKWLLQDLKIYMTFKFLIIGFDQYFCQTRTKKFPVSIFWCISTRRVYFSNITHIFIMSYCPHNLNGLDQIFLAKWHIYIYIPEFAVFSTRYNTQKKALFSSSSTSFLSVVAGTKYGGFRYIIST